MSDEFNWNPSNDEHNCIVIPHQPAIAVYMNAHDAIVVRQQDQYDESADQFVYITQENAPKVAAKMLALAGYPIKAEILVMMAERSDIDWAAVNRDFNELDLTDESPGDKTAAARQRRYRNKKRNAMPLLLAAE